MNKTTEALERVRSDARNLHEKLAEAASKNDEARRKYLQQVGAQAQQLATSLRTLAAERKSEVSAKLATAATSLEAAAASAKEAGKAQAAKLREHHEMMLAQMQSALKNIGGGRAAENAGAVKAR